jgi:hypothetical protein
MAGDDFGQEAQPAMKVVIAPRDDDDRQVLGTRPIEHCRKRHHVVVLTVDD